MLPHLSFWLYIFVRVSIHQLLHLGVYYHLLSAFGILSCAAVDWQTLHTHAIAAHDFDKTVQDDNHIHDTRFLENRYFRAPQYLLCSFFFLSFFRPYRVYPFRSSRNCVANSICITFGHHIVRLAFIVIHHSIFCRFAIFVVSEIRKALILKLWNLVISPVISSIHTLHLPSSLSRARNIDISV